MKKHLSAALLGLAVLASGPAIARSITVDVVRFHTGLAATGQTIALQPVDPALASSLEFASYANQVGASLEKLGFKPAAAGIKPDLIGTLSYSQTERETVVDGGRKGGFSIGVGVGTFGRHGGVSVGGSVPVGGDRDSPKGKIHTTTLELSLKRAGETTAVWEGRASTEGSVNKSSALPALIPALNEALLKDFPGTSGKTARLKINTQAKK